MRSGEVVSNRINGFMDLPFVSPLGTANGGLEERKKTEREKSSTGFSAVLMMAGSCCKSMRL